MQSAFIQPQLNAQFASQYPQMQMQGQSAITAVVQQNPILVQEIVRDIQRDLFHDDLIKQVVDSNRFPRRADTVIQSFVQGQPLTRDDIVRSLLADRQKDQATAELVNHIVVPRKQRVAMAANLLISGAQISPQLVQVKRNTQDVIDARIVQAARYLISENATLAGLSGADVSGLSGTYGQMGAGVGMLGNQVNLGAMGQQYGAHCGLENQFAGLNQFGSGAYGQQFGTGIGAYGQFGGLGHCGSGLNGLGNQFANLGNQFGGNQFGSLGNQFTSGFAGIGQNAAGLGHCGSGLGGLGNQVGAGFGISGLNTY